MTSRIIPLLLPLLILSSPDQLLSGAAATQPSPDDTEGLEPRFAAIARTLGPGGIDKDDVFTYTLPRADLELRTDAGPVPAPAAESRFHFFRCDCGKMNVVGQLVVADYEANDVIDALREGMIKVVSVGPMFIGEQPRVLVVRFQGEGGAETIAKTIKSALDWTGEARMTTRPTR
jgi:hypothetical protein